MGYLPICGHDIWEFYTQCASCHQERLAASHLSASDDLRKLHAEIDVLELRVADLERRLVDKGIKPPAVRRTGQGLPCVYFLRRKSDGLIKIGYSTNLELRLRDIRSGAGPVEVLATIEGGAREESSLHLQFQKARKHGEWFRPVPDLLNFIESLAS